jgi:hypothetical protein
MKYAATEVTKLDEDIMHHITSVDFVANLHMYLVELNYAE